MESISNWAWLPKNVLDMIIEKLVPMSDCIRLSLVCKPWRSAVIENFGLQNLNERRHDNLHRQQIPLLMIPTDDNSHERRGLYSVTQNKVSQQQLYVPYAKRCCGSSHGWLFIVEEASSVSLLNPFSGALICLPPFIGFYEEPLVQQGQEDQEGAFDKICIDHDFQEEEDDDDEEESGDEEDETDGEEEGEEDGSDDYTDDEDDDVDDNTDGEGEADDDDNVEDNSDDEEDSGSDDDDDDDDDAMTRLDHDSTHKVVLSKDPDLYPDDYVVMAIYGSNKRLAFIKSGDENWTYIHPELAFFEDIIYSHGKFLGVRICGDVWSCDATVSPPKVEKVARAVRPFPRCLNSYLVESPENGELILVYRLLDKNYMTDGFKVMKRQVKQGQSRWVETLNIGDVALFLGDNYSSSVLASDFPGCQPNCIYFADNFDFYLTGTPCGYHGGGGPCDNGFYNLTDRCFGKHYQLAASQEHMPPAIWIVPKFR